MTRSRVAIVIAVAVISRNAREGACRALHGGVTARAAPNLIRQKLQAEMRLILAVVMALDVTHSASIPLDAYDLSPRQAEGASRHQMQSGKNDAVIAESLEHMQKLVKMLEEHKDIAATHGIENSEVQQQRTAREKACTACKAAEDSLVNSLGSANNAHVQAQQDLTAWDNAKDQYNIAKDAYTKATTDFELLKQKLASSVGGLTSDTDDATYTSVCTQSTQLKVLAADIKTKLADMQLAETQKDAAETTYNEANGAAMKADGVVAGKRVERDAECAAISSGGCLTSAESSIITGLKFTDYGTGKPRDMPDYAGRGVCQSIDAASACDTRFEYMCQGYEISARMNNIKTNPVVQKCQELTEGGAQAAIQNLLQMASIVKNSVTDECKAVAAKFAADVKATKDYHPGITSIDDLPASANHGCVTPPDRDVQVYPLQKKYCMKKDGDIPDGYYISSNFDYAAAFNAVNQQIDAIISDCGTVQCAA